MKIFSKFVMLVFTGYVFVSCASDSESDVVEIPTTPITYTNTIAPLMSASCNMSGCHNNSSAAGGYILETYTQVRNAFENGSALSEIETGSMPLGGNKLSDTTINNVKSWIENGYAE